MFPESFVLAALFRALSNRSPIMTKKAIPIP